MPTASLKYVCCISKYKITVKCNSGANVSENCILAHRSAESTHLILQQSTHAKEDILQEQVFTHPKIRLHSIQQKFGSCRVDLPH